MNATNELYTTLRNIKYNLCDIR